MNILYLCQVFEVGTDAGSERHFSFCQYAVSKGHKATAITSNVDYKNARPKFPEERGTIRRSVGGVEVYYVYSYPNFGGRLFKRLYYYFTYFFSSAFLSFKLKEFDVIYAVSTPLTVGLMGHLLSRFWGIPFIFEVTDVWPDAAVACGVLKNKGFIKLAHWLEMLCYTKAARIVGLSRGICENIIAKGVAREKVSLITNGVDSTLFNLAGDNSKRFPVRAQFGFGDSFVAMYLGAHGIYNALDTIIDAAVRLKDDPRFLFVFVGAGDEKLRLQKRVSSNHLSRVVFFPPLPRVDSPAMLSAADAFLLPNRKGDFFAGNLPNKLFDFLASSRPVIVAGAGETAELVLAAGCGRVCAAGDSAAMAQALIELAEMPIEERMSMGARGRDYVLRHYNRKTLNERFLEIVADAMRHEYP